MQPYFPWLSNPAVSYVLGDLRDIQLKDPRAARTRFCRFLGRTDFRSRTASGNRSRRGPMEEECHREAERNNAVRREKGGTQPRGREASPSDDGIRSRKRGPTKTRNATRTKACGASKSLPAEAIPRCGDLDRWAFGASHRRISRPAPSARDRTRGRRAQAARFPETPTVQRRILAEISCGGWDSLSTLVRLGRVA